ncbi:TonB-dependent receptor [Sesbania bispinosa]|nr:TonB-dependent receptor [Sesbania bispinosa]
MRLEDNLKGCVELVDRVPNEVLEFYALISNSRWFIYEAIPRLSQVHGPVVGKTIEFTHAGGNKLWFMIMDEGIGENRHVVLMDGVQQVGHGLMGVRLLRSVPTQVIMKRRVMDVKEGL